MEEIVAADRLGRHVGDPLDVARVHADPEQFHLLRRRPGGSRARPAGDDQERLIVARPGRDLAGLADLRQLPRGAEGVVEQLQALGIPAAHECELRAVGRPGGEVRILDDLQHPTILRAEDRQAQVLLEEGDGQVAAVGAPGERQAGQVRRPGVDLLIAGGTTGFAGGRGLPGARSRTGRGRHPRGPAVRRPAPSRRGSRPARSAAPAIPRAGSTPPNRAGSPRLDRRSPPRDAPDASTPIPRDGPAPSGRASRGPAPGHSGGPRRYRRPTARPATRARGRAGTRASAPRPARTHKPPYAPFPDVSRGGGGQRGRRQEDPGPQSTTSTRSVRSAMSLRWPSL